MRFGTSDDFKRLFGSSGFTDQGIAGPIQTSGRKQRCGSGFTRDQRHAPSIKPMSVN